MKAQTMESKIKQLFLTGKTKLRKGNAYQLINEKSLDLMYACLYHDHSVTSIELNLMGTNRVSITATTKDNNCVLSGIIETY